MKPIFTLTIVLLLGNVRSGMTQPNAVQIIADSFVSAYNASDATRLVAQFNPQMKSAISQPQFAEFLSETAKTYGKILRLEAPEVQSPGATIFPVVFERGRLNLLLALDENGQIAGFRLTPPAPSGGTKRPVVRGKTQLALPFKGEWLVFWGGDTPAQNYHQDAPNQRFAFDILKVAANGKTHRGDGSKNEDYLAFGQPLLAPASGVVTDVVSGIRDNKPGEMNPMFAPGNMVVLRHQSGEYSLFGHLKLGSTRVKVGERVTQGQVVGLCGNSGNSSEAHLHYQLQKTPMFSSEGSVKAFFGKIVVRREGNLSIKTDYSPLKGDLVSNQN